MTEFIVFGGTSEGRRLATVLRELGISTLVCVATGHGETLLHAGGSVSAHTGRLDQSGMESLFQLHTPRIIIDATHPYAAEVSKNIRAACHTANVPCIRVQRESSASDGYMQFEDMDTLIGWLNVKPGVVFSALGAKEARALTNVSGFRERVWLRILPVVEGLSACLNAGFPAEHILCLQGPFSQELNAAMFRFTGASILLTKESGGAGGFEAKLAAARALGMTVAVLARPKEEDGLTLTELEQRIREGAL